jgi:hypothetical protein
MRSLLLFFALLGIIYGCNESSGKEPANSPKKFSSTAANQRQYPPEELRVKRDEAMAMRGRRKGDDASVKISAADLLSLMQNPPAANDSFIFYFVKHDGNSASEQRRYSFKRQNGRWAEISKKPSSLLVGYISGAANNTGMHLSSRPARATVAVYDLAVVCPPPPDCDCEIAQ